MMDLVLPRADRDDWEHTFMGIAILMSRRSPDPNTQVGAVLVSLDNRIISTGYNGLPRGISCGQINWSRDNEDELQTKYPFVIHAENNSILSAHEDLTGSSLFVTMHPCNECAQLIIQHGIKKVWYLCNPYKDSWQVKAANRMFGLVDIEVKQFRPEKDTIEINLKC
jgi:dCMP deaminase